MTAPAATAAQGAPATLLRRILLQGRYEALTMLQERQELILAVVLPLLALVGLTAPHSWTASGPAASMWRSPASWPCARCPRPLLVRASPPASIGGTGFSGSCPPRPWAARGSSRVRSSAVLAVLCLQVAVVTLVALPLGWQPPASGWLPGLSLLALGAVAFTALGLLVAGTVRPEATLAITNLLWILLGALGGIVIPAERLPALAQEWSTTCPPAHSARPCAKLSCTAR